MRTPITTFERATGIFLSIVLLFTVAAILAAGRRTEILDMFREGFVVYAVGAEGHGVAVGSPVKVRGVEVGTVTNVDLVHDPQHPDRPVKMTIRVQPRAAAFLGDETRAVVVEPPLGSGMPPFGTGAVELRTAGSRPLARRATLLAEGEESMVVTMSKMGRDMSAMRSQLTQTIDEMGTTFGNMRKLTEAMVDGRGVAGRVFSDGQLAGDLESMLRDARSATGDARKLMAALGKVTEQTPAVVQETRAATQDARKLMGKLDGAVEALPRLVASTERTLALTEELVKSLRSTAGYAPELARKVDMSLDETNRLVEAAQRNFLLRQTLPDRPGLRTDALVRPPVLLPSSSPAAGAP